MNFLNPIEILNLDNYPLQEVNEAIIRNTKRKFFTELHLDHNDELKIHDNIYSKSDCEKAIEKLSNESDLSFYYYLVKQENDLNIFLYNGDITFIETYVKKELHNDEDFINFINPFFAISFDKALLTAFTSNDKLLLQEVLTTKQLFSNNYINQAYNSLTQHLKRNITDIQELETKFSDESYELKEDEAEKTYAKIKQTFPYELLNLLPLEQFQSTINRIAERINFMQLKFGDLYSTKLKILSHIIKLKTNSSDTKDFNGNYDIVKSRYEKQLEEEKNAPILKQYSVALKEIDKLTDEVDANTIKAKDAINKISNLINVNSLNSLSSFADEIRNQIGYSVRSLAISCWNKQKDIQSALVSIKLALSINVSDTAKDKFTTDLVDLEEIKGEREKKGEPISEAPSLSTTNGIGTTIYSDTLYFVVFHIPILPIARYNCVPTGSGYRFLGKLKLHQWQKIWQWGLPLGIILWIIIASFIDSNKSNSGYNYTTSTNPQIEQPVISKDNSTEPLPPLPAYNTVYMKNGNISGCEKYKPRYDETLNNRLEISVSATSDAALKLINIDSRKCVRFVYINAGSNYTIRNIPEGKYFTKIAYGNEWKVKEGEANCTGKFSKNVIYKKGDNILDYNIVEEGTRRRIPSYSLELYTTIKTGSDSTYSTNKINEDDFDN